MDPATRVGLEKNDREFGQTFGKWGIGTDRTSSYRSSPLGRQG